MNKKIIVSTLALAMGAALAGSVSGTVAWFQYSTRAQATYIGTSAHCSELLEIRANGSGSFASELSKVEAASGFGTSLEPISSGAMNSNAALNKIGGTGADKDDAKFFKNPVYQFADPEVWGKADKTNYVQFTLDFHVKDVDGKSTATYLGNHNLYLTNIDIVSLTNDTTTNDLDLNKAVRVHISDGASYNALFAVGDASTGTVTTVVHGNLDLNGDNQDDKTTGYDWTSDRELVDYGNPNSDPSVTPADQVAYDTKSAANYANDTNPSLVGQTTAAPGLIGAITGGQEVGKTLTVTIWLEGWTKLGAVADNPDTDEDETKAASAVWDAATYVGKKFGVGLRFATELHTAHE